MIHQVGTQSIVVVPRGHRLHVLAGRVSQKQWWRRHSSTTQGGIGGASSFSVEPIPLHFFLTQKIPHMANSWRNNGKKKNKHRHDSNPASNSNSGQGGAGGVDNDIVAQLQRQRQKQAQQKLLNESSNFVEAVALERRVGNFQYNPITQRYFPKSTFTTNGSTDACIQRAQKHLLVTTDDDNNSTIDNDQLRRPAGALTIGDIRRTSFRRAFLYNYSMYHNNGQRPSTIHEKKKLRANTVKKSPPFPCTERTKLLLTSSLEYCAMSRKRNLIYNMLGPIIIAKRATITPNLLTLERLRSKTEDFTKCSERSQARQFNAFPIHKWCRNVVKSRSDSSSSELFSMLIPLSNSNRQWSNDCDCKSYLQSTSPTFDVMPSVSDKHSIHIATIANNLDYNWVHYQRPLYGTGYSELECISGSSSKQISGVCLATNGLNFFVGYTIHDKQNDQNSFSLKQTMHNMVYEEEEVAVEVTYALVSPVNDFCFARNSSKQINSSNSTESVVFAHGYNSDVNASFLDITVGSYTSIRNRWSKSEPLCVQFRSNNESNHTLFGHRDGSVSMLDSRSSNDVHFLNLPCATFGSVSNLLSLQNNDNLVAVKGSFGECCVFDLRSMSISKDQTRKIRSQLLDLSLPDHRLHRTRSVRCTGIATDPSESIVMAPFADLNDGIRFALWDISTGALLRTLRLNGVDNSEAVPGRFCELSSVVTPGFRMRYDIDSNKPIVHSEGWGLWFKTNSLPNDCGGIHHMRF